MTFIDTPNFFILWYGKNLFSDSSLDGLFEVEILVMHFRELSSRWRGRHANQVQNNKDHAQND